MKTEITIENLLKACSKAANVSRTYLREHGESPVNCGFAWVIVKGARGKKSNVLKELGFKKSFSESGLYLWNPSGLNTQDMSVKLSGAEAFAEELKSMGLDARAHCRYD